MKTPEQIAAEVYRTLSGLPQKLSGGRLREIMTAAIEADRAQREQDIDVVFDDPPSHLSGRFVEVETPDGASINVGEWIDRGDGYWALRIKAVRP